MNQPHINQILTLSDGTRAMVYRIQMITVLCPGKPLRYEGYVAKCVTASGERREVYL